MLGATTATRAAAVVVVLPGAPPPPKVHVSPHYHVIHPLLRCAANGHLRLTTVIPLLRRALVDICGLVWHCSLAAMLLSRAS